MLARSCTRRLATARCSPPSITCGRSWPSCGSARAHPGSSCWATWRTGACAPMAAASSLFSSSRSGCAATPDNSGDRSPVTGRKKARLGGLFCCRAFSGGALRPTRTRGDKPVAAAVQLSLFDLRFLVDDVLARDRIVLLDLHLVRRRALVLRRRVEMARAGRGLEFDFLAHISAPLTAANGQD